MLSDTGIGKFSFVTGAAILALATSAAASAASGPLDYRILATSRISTMEKELNDAAATGYRFSKAMGGETANGGHQVVVAVVKDAAVSGPVSHTYKVLATTRTSTMQNEIQHLADAGYEYLDQTVFNTAFGGKQVVVIMERDSSRANPPSSYRVLATSKTSTMEKELKQAGEQGYSLMGLTVGKTEIGGDEIVSIVRSKQPQSTQKPD